MKLTYEEEKFHTKVKLKLMMACPVFISTVLFSLRVQWVDDSVLPTAGTDGTRLLINKNWYTKLQLEEAIGLLLHEAWHVAYQHMIIGKNLEKDRHNQACDYLINLQVVADGFKIPPDGLYDTQYAGMSSMEIYHKLKNQPQPQGYSGDLLDPISNSEVAKAEIENILLRAAKLSKEAGDKPGAIPGELERYIDELLNPILPWNVILQNYVDALAKDDFTWARPNRRYPDMYLPSLQSDTIANVSVLIDASGSVGEEEMREFFTEIKSIKDKLHPEKLLVGSFDTRLYEAKEFDEFEHYSVLGGGGTSADPIREFAEKHNPNVLIVFTDMEMNFYPLEDMHYKDIIWINTGPEVEAPVGKIIHYNPQANN